MDFKRLRPRRERQRAAPDLEQHDAGGDREIERIGAAGLRDAHQPVAGCGQRVGQALLLVAHQQQHRPAGIVDACGSRPRPSDACRRRGRESPCARRGTPPACLATGTAKIEPMVARTVSSENGSVVSPTRMTPLAPTASTVRMTVPRLPGSRTRSSATQTSPSAGLTSRKRRQALLEDADDHLRIVAPGDRASTFSLTSSTVPPAATVRAATFSTAALPRAGLGEDQRADRPAEFERVDDELQPFGDEGVLLVAELLQRQRLDVLDRADWRGW